MVEHEGFAFPVSIEYEGLPDFCTHCHSIGHNINSCRRLHPLRAETHEQPINVGKKTIDNGKQPVQKQTWKSKDNPNGIGSSKAFASVDSEQHDVSIPKRVLLDKDITVPTQQQATSTTPQELVATQFTDEGDIADVTTDKDTDKAIPNDTTQMAVPQNSVNKEFEATYTFEDQT